MIFIKKSLLTIPVFLLFLCLIKKESSILADTCITEQEIKLYDLINSYRKQKGLPKIPMSKSLTFVAQTHAKDLEENKTVHGDCNAHSWSKKGKWTSCCYTPDHKQQECMWNKPRELTNYTANGFEISYYSSIGVVPNEALNGWKTSSGHNAVIINSGIWKNSKWNAIGIGIYKNYATVWFGVDPDKEGEPKKCLN